MPHVQLRFQSSFKPPAVIGQWWKHYGMGGGMPLPNPLARSQTSTCGGYESDLWVNLELWRDDESKGTIARLSAESVPFGDSAVKSILQRVADSLQPPPIRAVPATALAPDSFTWIGGWDWTSEEGAPGHWRMSKIDEILATAPRGLVASDGSLLGHGTKMCKLGFVDAPRRAIYLAYDWLSRSSEGPELEISEGCGSVPLSSVPGIRVLRTATNAYSASVSADGSTLAIIEYSSSVGFGRGYVTLIDVATGDDRGLTWFDHATGSEQIAFSPDDRWLLVPRTGRDFGALIIDAETGQQQSFDSLNHATCWWVQNGHLGLLSVGQGAYDGDDADPYTVVFHDFTTGTDSDIAKITPPPYTMDLLYQWLWQAEAHGTGKILVDMSIPPVDSRRYNTHRSLAVLDLETGDLTQAVEPFADPDHYVLRRQSKWHWNSPLAALPTEEPTTLHSSAIEVDVSAWPQIKDEYGVILRVDFDSPFLTG